MGHPTARIQGQETGTIYERAIWIPRAMCRELLHEIQEFPIPTAMDNDLFSRDFQEILFPRAIRHQRFTRDFYSEGNEPPLVIKRLCERSFGGHGALVSMWGREAFPGVLRRFRVSCGGPRSFGDCMQQDLEWAGEGFGGSD